VGACLFVLESSTGEKVEAITRHLRPFILAEVAILILIAFWADLTLFIPRLLGL
jgi:TRAP-type C4-dicarboxylate transport system permease large subunit